MLSTIKTWVINSALNRRPIAEWPMAWVYAPKPGDVEFALRNTIAALFALAIAFWWELGEPQWAAMTVWIVAQGSRGESLSKGRWRLVGTILGMVSAISLVGIFPQQPWLFLPTLAFWAGLCTGLATLVHNFRSYAFVLAAYTCAIIAMDASAEPHHVFQIAMARGTYIFLGVICEMVAGMVFSQDLPQQARKVMRARLLDAITSATAAVYDIVREEPPPESDVRAVYGLTLTLHDQIEFSAVEIGRKEHSVQYAYATTGILSRIMSRALGLKARLAAVPNRTRASQTILIRTTEFLSALPQRLALAENVPEARNQLDELIGQCVHAIGTTLENENAAGDDEAARTLAINDRIVLQGMRLILGEYHMLLTFFHGDEQRKLRPAHYRLRHLPNWRAALHNGVRTSAAIILAALVWEATAWPSGAGFVSFIAVVCGRFGTFENTVLVSNQFFYGACVAVLVSIIPVFLMIPVASSFGALALALAPAMFLAGLALRNPGTALPAASFATFFPAILGLDNQHRMDEITWFNNSMALLAGLGGGVLVFRCVLPFDEKRVCRIMRLRVLTGLSDIGRGVRRSLDDNRWIGITTQSMQSLIRYAGRRVPPLVDTYLHGTLAVMTMGRNLIHLRRVNAEPTMPDDARVALQEMFLRMATHRLTVEELRAAVGDALAKLRAMEAAQDNAASRLALTDAIGSLLIVSTEVNGNELFFDDRKFHMSMLLPSIATA